MTQNNDNLVYYKFLVKLRDMGITNMWGAAPYLQEAFDLDEEEAKAILLAWIGSFEGRFRGEPNNG